MSAPIESPADGSNEPVEPLMVLPALSSDAPTDDSVFGDMPRRLASILDHANRRKLIPVDKDGHKRVVVIADVRRESVRWLWPGRLAQAKLNLLAGDPGLGKSFLMLDWAARITTGRKWPDGAQAVAIGNVIVLSTEDDAADTIRPRFEDMGGDLHRLYVQKGDPLSLAFDMTALEAMIRATGAVLVGIDPLNDYLGDSVDSYGDKAVRKVMRPLTAMAARTGAAILMVKHFTKADEPSADKPGRKTLYRISDSIGFVGSARVVMAVKEDPADPDRTRLLVNIKRSVSASVPTMAYRLDVPLPDRPVVVWDGMREGGPVAKTDPQFEADCATLLAIVADGAVLAEMGKKAAKEAGLSPTGDRFRRAYAATIQPYRLAGTAKTIWLWQRKGEPLAPGALLGDEQSTG
jgi:hypothetical protein